MNIVMLASECAPVAKVGGLGDVVAGLSRELGRRGHTVDIILPRYDCMRHDHIQEPAIAWQDLWVPWNGGAIHCTVHTGLVQGLRCFFIEPHSAENFFSRGQYYGYPDEALRMTFFSKAALEFLLHSGRRPDILHCHDWQTALAPVLLYEIYARLGMERTRVCFTVHNFGHQGITGEEILWASGLGRPERFASSEVMGIGNGALNLMKGALLYANFITTVSPHHAWEVRHTELGMGLGHELFLHQNKFKGILNGLDYESWNPATDPSLPHHFDAAHFGEKARARHALRERFLLRQEGAGPLVAYVGRLDAQKGVNLIRHGMFHTLWNGGQFVLLGASPDPEIGPYFQHLKAHLNDSPDCHLELGFSEELARLIYAGADLLIMPSNYEPCGLTQLIALRYGTVPVVRAVGGLQDTVFDWDYADRPREERNGFTFLHPDYTGIESALNRAFGLWRNEPRLFRQLAVQGMRQDYSWARPCEEYLGVYEFIRHKE